MFVLEIGRKLYPTIADLTLKYADTVSAFTVMQDIIDHGENASELWFKLEKETPVTEEIDDEESATEETTQPDSITEEPEPSTEEADEKQKRKPVDYEAIFSLNDAGWTNEKIADEVGCSLATVSNSLKKRRDREI